jgi:Fe-S-cluster containining protein
MENGILTDICKKCAECCKNHPFVDLSENEIYSLKQLTGLHSDVFTNKKGKIVEEYFLQFQENGDCFFLNENNGSFSCTVYEARPEICKNYPSKPTQIDFCDASSEKFLRNNFG